MTDAISKKQMYINAVMQQLPEVTEKKNILLKRVNVYGLLQNRS